VHRRLRHLLSLVLRLALALALLTTALAGCSALGGATPTPSPATVRLALDWTPNTNHTGFFVARHEGWYADAGISLEVLPYGTSSPETLVSAGQAECGISFQDSMTFANAAGGGLVSVMAILQRTASAIAVLETSGIARPKDLDGKTYAGFGYPNEEPTLKAVIEADGGTGRFEVATLNEAAYEALFAGRADFTIVFTAWEGVEAEQRGIPLRYFRFSDYGFPEFYQVVLACNRGWLEAQPDLAKRLVGATARGFKLAADEPSKAAQMLIDENPGVFATAELPVASAIALAEGRFLVDENGTVGTQTLERWQGYGQFLFDAGLLVDDSGSPMSEPPDFSSYFTNDFLP